ncbi:hypothetical protein IW262DRAFT_1301656 [Armillaria fumosa]|nr:hypothetical protein IW262DRAFT_1301656 [Armillaria fumosa]
MEGPHLAGRRTETAASVQNQRSHDGLNSTTARLGWLGADPVIAHCILSWYAIIRMLFLVPEAVGVAASHPYNSVRSLASESESAGHTTFRQSGNEAAYRAAPAYTKTRVWDSELGVFRERCSWGLSADGTTDNKWSWNAFIERFLLRPADFISVRDLHGPVTSSAREAHFRNILFFWNKAGYLPPYVPLLRVAPLVGHPRGFRRDQICLYGDTWGNLSKLCGVFPEWKVEVQGRCRLAFLGGQRRSCYVRESSRGTGGGGG